jgi:adenylate cyclase class IV
MARNVEIKARVADRIGLEQGVARLAERGPTPIMQRDTFFHCAHGRLKLRDFGDGSGELIAYQRPDGNAPRLSTYLRSPTSDPTSLRLALAAACGVRGEVRKRRTLYLIGATRVHLDEVDGLGELEVVLREDQVAADGEALAHRLCEVLEIPSAALVGPAYIDLLEQKETTL